MLKKVQKYFNRNSTITILVIFTIIFTSLTLKNLINQNLVGDEAVYIVEGDRYIHQPYSFYHNSGSPAFLKILTALPYALLPLDRDYGPYFRQVFTNVYTVAAFTYEQNEQYAKLIIVLARLPHFVLSLLLGYTIFLFAKRALSMPVAVIALCFYTFHATFLAHASTANLDIGVTAFTFWSLCSIYLFLQTPRTNHITIIRTRELSSTHLLLFAGILLGIAQTTKISAILLYPFLILWFCLHKNDKKVKDIVLLIGISIITIWTIYLFQVGPILTADDTPAGIESVYGSMPVLRGYKEQITQLLYLPIYPLGAFLNNFAYQLSHSFYGHTNYIKGEFTDQRIWYYIPLVFTIKNSVIFTISCLLGGIVAIISMRKKRIYLFLFLWIALMVVWSMQSKIQLGLRYVLPIFPFLFIIAAAGLYWIIEKVTKPVYRNIVIGIVLVLYAISTARVGTNYFTYISELYRGYNPVDLVFDSDYDWGQNVYKLSSEQKSKSLYPLYFQPYIGGDLSFEGIQSEMSPVSAFYEKRNGYYAFSHSSFVNMRLNNPEVFSYFYSKRPTYIINKTIYVYAVTFN